MDGFKELPYEYQIFANLFRVSNLLQTKMDRELNEITSKQWYVLAALDYIDNNSSLTQLSGLLNYSHQNTKAILDKLEAKKFIKIEKSKIDKRRLVITKLEKCNRWILENEKNNRAFMKLMFGGVEKQSLEITSDFLNELYERLEKL